MRYKIIIVIIITLMFLSFILPASAFSKIEANNGIEREDVTLTNFIGKTLESAFDNALGNSEYVTNSDNKKVEIHNGEKKIAKGIYKGYYISEFKSRKYDIVEIKKWGQKRTYRIDGDILSIKFK